ncbi:MAG TPA: hypothetical protein VHY79_12510 [Rhizomicrobium sp.]|nr:hypothetical protein [Rhizomicrobium sp.]
MDQLHGKKGDTMFRCGLLATTALVIVGSLSFLAAQSAAVARAPTLGPERNRNQEFLCNYGELPVSGFSYYAYSRGSEFFSGWTHVAVPVVGHGQTVRRITVAEGESRSPNGTQFLAGIYSNTASGLPGYPIAVGIAKAPPSCRKVHVQIASTTLEPNTKYWIEETAPRDLPQSKRPSHRFTHVYWATDSRTRPKAYVQSHYYSSFHSYSYTTPWTRQPVSPFFKLK